MRIQVVELVRETLSAALASFRAKAETEGRGGPPTRLHPEPPEDLLAEAGPTRICSATAGSRGRLQQYAWSRDLIPGLPVRMHPRGHDRNVLHAHQGDLG